MGNFNALSDLGSCFDVLYQKTVKERIKSIESIVNIQRHPKTPFYVMLCIIIKMHSIWENLVLYGFSSEFHEPYLHHLSLLHVSFFICLKSQCIQQEINRKKRLCR